jgi:hypothetical protein
VALSWVKQILRFWNKVVGRPDDDLVKIAMVESCALARSQVKGCWTSQLARFLQQYGVDLLAGDRLLELDTDAILQQVEESWWQSMTTHIQGFLTDTDPDLSVVRAQSDDRRSGFKQLTYFNWFANEGEVHTRFWFHLTRKVHINNMAQLRLGSHWLGIETDRFVRPRIPRSRRICKCCEAGIREDELHFMLGCTTYGHLRQQAGTLLGSVGQVCDSGVVSSQIDQTMKAVMNPPPGCTDPGGFWKDMAVFVGRCKSWREHFVGSRDRAADAS